MKTALQIVALAALAGQAMGQCQFTNFSASDRAASDNFGNAVAVGGQIMAVGAWQDDNSVGANAGSVYVFTRDLFGNGFSQTQRLQDSGGQPDNLFGRTLATDGTSLMVGSAFVFPGQSTIRGDVNMYRMQANGFFQAETLPAPSGLSNDADFGSSMAVSGSIAVVGAPFQDSADGQRANVGAAYIYRRTNGVWGSPAAVLEPLNFSAAGDRVGQSVAISGSTVVVGIPFANITNANGTFSDAGTVVVIGPSGNAWNVNAVLASSASTTTADRRMGFAVAIDGTTIVAGAPGDDVSGNLNAGRVYVFTFENSQWTYQQRLTPTDSVANLGFGSRVEISGDRMMIRSSSAVAQKAYLFKRSESGNWYQDRILEASEYSGTNAFPSSIDLSGTQAFIGDVLADYAGASDAGRMSVIEVGGIGGDSTSIADAVTAGGSYHGCTFGATPTASFLTAPCGASEASKDVWYSFTPAAAGIYRVDTIGSSFDTVLGLFTIPQQLPLLNQLACNDDFEAPVSRDSKIEWEMAVGATYFIRVAGYNGAEGSFTLNVNRVCPADLNQDGTVDFNDYLEFLNLYNVASLTVDFNSDGVTDFNDYLEFLNLYNAGC